MASSIRLVTGADMRARMHETLAMYPWLVLDRGGEIGGYAYATKHRVRAGYQWSVDTSIFVHPSFRRSGVGRGLYASLFAILAAQGYVNAYAGIALPNPASVALHERAGFEPFAVYRRVGYKFGAWHDVGWWQRALGEHEANPQKPLALRTIQDRAGWQALLETGLPMIGVSAQPE